MNINRVIIVGRLTKDPDVRTTQGGQSVTSFSMATNSFYTDKSGQKQENTEFHNIVLWGRLAEVAGKYLVKGQECGIEGRLQTRNYEDKQGVKRYVTEIVGEHMHLGSRPKGYDDQRASQPSHAEAPQTAPQEDIPTINLEDDNEVKIEDVPF